jgi:hypothetical protein
MSPDAPSDRRGPLHRLARGRSLLRWEALLFIVLSVGDLLMTYTLLWRHVKFYESNPIAGWVLERWDVAGMTAFKFGLVAFIILISEAVERLRPRRDRLILVFGIVGTLYAIVEGYRLLLEHG